jgi:exopolyphosphatase/guanosine-5'-triphosphate,3'-diphosphate pyrophosphatase
VIAGGLAILYTLASTSASPSCAGARRAAPGRDLRPRRALPGADAAAEGHDIRDASVRDLQRRFVVDVEQAERVRAVAEALHARVRRSAATRRGASCCGRARCTRSA